MEIFGNPITGYRTEHYSKLIENHGRMNEVYLVKQENLLKTHPGFSNNYSGHSNNGKNKNCYSKISAKGLKKKIQKVENHKPKIKKVKIPLWTYFNNIK